MDHTIQTISFMALGHRQPLAEPLDGGLDLDTLNLKGRSSELPKAMEQIGGWKKDRRFAWLPRHNGMKHRFWASPEPISRIGWLTHFNEEEM